MYAITNRGDDEALNVRVILTVDKEEVRVRTESVAPGGTIEIECPKAFTTFREELAKYEAEVREYEISVRAIPFTMEPQIYSYATHYIHERIDWVTHTGKSDVHDVEHRLATLGNFN